MTPDEMTGEPLDAECGRRTAPAISAAPRPLISRTRWNRLFLKSPPSAPSGRRVTSPAI